jgi:hypothetical protein
MNILDFASDLQKNRKMCVLNNERFEESTLLKRNSNTIIRKLLILFSIDNPITNIILYALSRHKCYLTFEIVL